MIDALAKRQFVFSIPPVPSSSRQPGQVLPSESATAARPEPVVTVRNTALHQWLWTRTVAVLPEGTSGIVSQRVVWHRQWWAYGKFGTRRGWVLARDVRPPGNAADPGSQPLGAQTAGMNTLAFLEDFSGDLSRWHAWPGYPGGAVVHDGMATLTSGTPWAATIMTGQLDDSASAYVGGQSWTYGYFESRIRYTTGVGWPAFWMVGTTIGQGTRWPEIDILEENASADYGLYWATVNLWDPWPTIALTTQGSNAVFTYRDLSGWHVYAVRWRPGEVIFYFDDTAYLAWQWTPGDGSEWNLLDGAQMFMILGTLPGGEMDVDWVRVWQ